MKPLIFNKLLILIIFTLSIFYKNDAIAQNISEGYWGVKAGLNINKVSQIKFDNKMKFGYHFGLYANFQLSNKLSMQHEILYSTKGVSITLPSNAGTYNKTYSYIELPWSLNYHFTRNLYMTAGLNPSVYTYFSAPKPDTIPYNKDNLNIIDLGYFLGAALMLDNNFGFGIRFNGGIFPAFDIENNSGKNYTFQVFAQYGINKKKKGRRPKIRR